MLLAVGLLACLPLAPSTAPIETSVPATDPAQVRVGILYVSTESGNKFRLGVVDAIERHPLKDSILPVGVPYRDDLDGYRELKRLVGENPDEDRLVDVVIGPTNSGVFRRALEDEGLEHTVPIVSSMVTADTPIPSDAWFFRTNVGDDQRACAISHLVGKYWLRSCAVLYEDNEFGQRAEVAFREKLPAGLIANYQPLQFEATGDARPRLEHVLENRPEALGIFASRERIAELRRELRLMDGSVSSYDPLFFTVVDVREHADELEGFYFVSLLDSNDVTLNDARVLAGETTAAVLDTIARIGVDAFAADLATFKPAFDRVLRGTVEVDPDRPDVIPTDLPDAGDLAVFHIGAEGIEKIDLDRNFGVYEKLRVKIRLLASCFGRRPYYNLALIVGLVVVFNILDLRRWYRGSVLNLVNIYSLIFIAVNTVLVVALYVFLAETEKISYGSTLAALILAVTPTALLRSTFFDSPGGKAVGMANMYDRLLLWINDRLATRKFQERQPYVNALAYYNSLSSMRDRLYQIFNNTRDRSLADQTRRELDDEIDRAPNELDQRRVCARRLLRRFEWKRLVALQLVPEDFRCDPPPDPETVLRMAETRIAERGLRGDLDELVGARIATAKDRDKEAGAKLEQSLRACRSDYERLRFIMSEFMITPTTLVREKLLSPTWRDDTPSVAPAPAPGDPFEVGAENVGAATDAPVEPD